MDRHTCDAMVARRNDPRRCGRVVNRKECRLEMARPEGFEPPTNGFGSHYSIRLSYGRVPRDGEHRGDAFSHDCPQACRC